MALPKKTFSENAGIDVSLEYVIKQVLMIDMVKSVNR